MQELALRDMTGANPSDFEPTLEPRIENRKHPRLLTQGEAEIVIDNGTSIFQGRILNMTPSGCFIQTLKYVHLAPYARVEVIFLVNGKEVTVNSEVRFTTPAAGIGFRFLDSDNAMQAILDTVRAGRALQPQLTAQQTT